VAVKIEPAAALEVSKAMSLYEFLILGIYLFLLTACAMLVQTDAYPRVAAEKLRILLPSPEQDAVEEQEEEEGEVEAGEEEGEEEFTMTENPMFVHREEVTPVEKED
jgi:hypothetical protein